MHIQETHTKPTSIEMESRLNRLQTAMAEQALDAYVLTEASDVLWLTNFANHVHERPFILLVPATGEPVFLVPRLELDHCESRIVGKVKYVTYTEFPAPVNRAWEDRLEQILPQQAKRIAIAPTTPIMIANVVGDRAKITGVIEDVRAIKSDYELGRIAYACRILSEAHDKLLKAARIGLSQSDITASFGAQIFQQLCEDDPHLNPFATHMLTLIQNPAASHDPHNFSDLDMAMVEGGPHISVFNATLNGYGAEIERTFFLDYAPEPAKIPFEIMMEARRTVFEKTKPGVRMHDVDHATNEVFRANGYSTAMRHRAGHGMGVTAHEGPFLAEGEHKIIQPRMVFTIEPGIYVPGLGGFRHSDTVVTTESGLSMLTSGPETLAELTL